MDEANSTRIMEAAYAEFEPSLRRRLTAFVRDEATAQDLTQESFVRLLAEVRADRVPENIGGYPVNYGFVPQTVSYDGDPFDILVLGPPIEGGSLVRGGIVGLLLMNDEKGYDAKVVVSPLKNGRPEYALTARVRQDIADYFRRYKSWEPDKFSFVPGWGTGAEGLSLIQMTHAFFLECRQVTTTNCRIAR
jgi:inorganic pyrophosphatase